MPWIRFTGHFDWRVPAHKGLVTIAYKAGTTRFVTRQCAADAIAAGKGELTTRPIKEN